MSDDSRLERMVEAIRKAYPNWLWGGFTKGAEVLVTRRLAEAALKALETEQPDPPAWDDVDPYDVVTIRHREPVIDGPHLPTTVITGVLLDFTRAMRSVQIAHAGWQRTHEWELLSATRGGKPIHHEDGEPHE